MGGTHVYPEMTGKKTKQKGATRTTQLEVWLYSHDGRLRNWLTERPLPRCCSVAKSSQTLCVPTECSVPGFPALHYLCRPLFSLPSIFPSIRVCSNESALHIRWPKYWSFNFSIRPSSEYSGLTSFRIDWLDLLVFHGTLKSLLQHNLKASILWHWPFFMVQLSHPYVTSGKP